MIYYSKEARLPELPELQNFSTHVHVAHLHTFAAQKPVPPFECCMQVEMRSVPAMSALSVSALGASGIHIRTTHIPIITNKLKCLGPRC